MPLRPGKVRNWRRPAVHCQCTGRSSAGRHAGRYIRESCRERGFHGGTDSACRQDPEPSRGSRPAENDIVASVGGRGDSFDNKAAAVEFNKPLRVAARLSARPRQGVNDIEFALGYIDCSITDASTERSPTTPRTSPLQRSKSPSTSSRPAPVAVTQ
jgi:hypothetical protein